MEESLDLENLYVKNEKDLENEVLSLAISNEKISASKKTHEDEEKHLDLPSENDSLSASRSSTATFGGSRTGTPLLTQTISNAYRSKIRSRIASAQEKHRVHKKDLDEEIDLNQCIKERSEIKEKWRSTIQTGLVGETKEKLDQKMNESYKFFTQTIFNEENIKPIVSAITSTAEVNSSISSQEKEEEIDEDKDEMKLLMATLFTSTENLYSCERFDSFIIEENKRNNQLKDIITITPVEPLEDYIKFGRESNFNPIEDGLYIEKIPYWCQERNYNRLEQRLYRESKLKWFKNYQYIIFNQLHNYFTYWRKIFNSSIDTSKNNYNNNYNNNIYNFIKNYNNNKILENDLHQFKQHKSQPPQKQFKLILLLDSLQFSCHPLFNEETTIASQLIEYFQIFNQMNNELTISLLNNRIDSLTVSINNLETSLKSSNEDDEYKEKQERLRKYRKQRIQIIDERKMYLQKYRQLLINLLGFWEELRNRRNIQGFNCTNIKLKYSEIVNETMHMNEQKILEEMINNEFKMRKEYYNDNYYHQLENYRKILRIWKEKERNFRRESKNEINTENLRSNECQQINDSKPRPPEKKYDDKQLMNLVKENILLFDSRLPGEPKFDDIHLENTIVLTPINDLPEKERKRQNTIRKYHYLIELYIDGMLKGKSKLITLDCNFTGKLNAELISLCEKEPKEIILHIIENKGKSNHFLASIFIPLPEIYSNNLDIDIYNNYNNLLNYSDFTSAKTFLDERKQAKMTRGKLFYNCYLQPIDDKNNGIDNAGDVEIACGNGGISNDHSNYNRSNKLLSYINLNTSNISKINKYIKNTSSSYCDPNDPENIELLYILQSYQQLMIKNNNLQQSFHLDPMMNQFNFINPDVINNNPRIHLLMKRSSGYLPLKAIPIPLNEREILYSSDNKMPLASRSSFKLTQSEATNKKGIEAKRARALNIYSRVREKLIKQAQGDLDRPKTWDDLVIESETASLTLGFNLFTPTQKKRPLHPSRRERKRITTVTNHTEVKLIITVMHALNVPVRVDSGKNDNEKRSSITCYEFGDISYESKVSPFVEACFQRQTCRTSTAEGPQPTWNETLSINLRAPNDDFSPSSLTTIDENIYLNLFDEIPVYINDDVHLERRWLGSIEIPFSTVYINSKIEGTVKLNIPSVLLGYEHNSRIFNVGQTLTSTAYNSVNTYLTLFLTIDPTLPLPEPLILKCDSLEDETILIHGQKWESDLRSHFPKRAIKAFAVDLNAQFVLITRYLRPLKPPESLLSNNAIADEIMLRLARFVSLIPSIPDNIALPGFGDIWCTSNQFLEMLVGDEEEHAILLCNFFLYLGKRAAVILGSGIPEGPTAYVIVWEYSGQDPSIWNPSTGEKYDVHDSYLPLNTVGSIFTSDNVYANIQKYDHPNRLVYDITKTSYWKPLFNRKLPNPGLISIQPEIINFEQIDEQYVKSLQENLEKHLRDSLMRWRKTSRTYFNRSCIQKIKKILPSLEKKYGKIESSDFVQELEDILIAHKIIGFPLNMCYTNMESITEAVYATGVHLIEDNKADFALAVYLHPYPCNILSVWVYIAALCYV